MSRGEVRGRVALWGGAVAVVLIAAAIVIPASFGWNVHVNSFPPLHAEWMPRIGPGLPVAIAMGVLGVLFAPRLSARLRWMPLQAIVFGAALIWLLSLALVDGLDGIGTILNHRYEYLGTARSVTDFAATLSEYIERIPYAHEDNWPVHIAGHPPGALLFFYVLVRVGLGSGLAAGLVVIVIGASIPVAVLGTMRALGAERFARRAAPFLVFMPAAIWIGVSGDGMFAAFAAWGLWALARAATTRTRAATTRRRAATTRRGGGGTVAMAAWAVLAGLLLGYCVMLSYGLPLLGVLALAVLFAARQWWPLPIAAAAALVVVLVFAAGGFAWWEAFPVLQQRYWDGVASRRPPEYWMWGNLAAFAVSAGPMVGASLAGGISAALSRRSARRDLSRHRALTPGALTPGAVTPGAVTPGGGIRVVLLLVGAAWLTILLADLSNMSRAEVERIWLPFVPWALVGLSLFAAGTRRVILTVQITFAIVVQSLLQTGW